VFRAQTLAGRPSGLPEITLAHVQTMTDDTGMLQHATFNVPRYEDGYCVDDNARALLLMALLEEAGGEHPAQRRALSSRYLAFVNHGFDRATGRFRNFMSYGRQWLEACGSEDSHGRALWALGAFVARTGEPGRHNLARDLFQAAMPATATFTSPRAWAFALLALNEYLKAFQGDVEAAARRDALAARLFGLFVRTSAPGWSWFEDSVTYCNAQLSQALIVSGDRMQRGDMVEAGMRSLEWLVSLQTSADGYFAPIGSNGFYVRGGSRADFDQQPVEAGALVSACLEAHRVNPDGAWLTRARWAFNWFLGENHLRQWLFDPSNGGCRDGLHADRANENQGAEATLSFLLALQDLWTESATGAPPRALHLVT
jgi:hypothetical protein